MYSILFDLDGTLIDPGEGIVSSFRHALKEVGFQKWDVLDTTRLVGPPLRESFSGVLGNDAAVDQAIKSYRNHFEVKGRHQAFIYPDVTNILSELKFIGHELFICTAKARPAAEQLIEQFNLTGLFKGIYGAELDGRFENKADLMAHILSQENLDPARTIMIGDRDNDIMAALSNKTEVIGVLWGFGDRQELAAAGCLRLVSKPSELMDQIRNICHGHQS